MNSLQRRKRAFMSLITRPLGFVRSMSGTLPLSLPYAMEGKADGYTIEGKSVQDGTPSPENPIEIKSVGVKTRNLIDYTKRSTATPGGVTFTNNLDGTFTASGMMASVTPSYTLLSAITEDFEVGIPYTFGSETGHYDDNGVRYWMMIAIKNAETNTVRYLVDYSTNTFTLSENEYVSMLDIRLNSPSGTLYEVDNVVYKPFIYKGECEPKFEPYGKYKLNVVNRGVNLFDGTIHNLAFSRTTNGDRFLSNSTYRGIYAKVTPGKTYSVSRNIISSNRFRYCWSEEVPSVDVTPFGLYTSASYDTFNKIEGLIAPDNANYLFIYLSNQSEDISGTDFQIQEGSTATDYEPYRSPVSTPIYLDEPLRGIGDYKDKIDFESGTVERKIVERMFDGGEEWRTSNKVVYLAWRGILSSTNCFSTHLPNDEKTVSGKLFVRPVTDVLRISRKSGVYEDIDEWKSLLSQWNESGNPFTVVTQLSTPKTESITLPELPLVEGTNILSIEGDIQPEMTIIYKSSVKEV